MVGPARFQTEPALEDNHEMTETEIANPLSRSHYLYIKQTL